MTFITPNCSLSIYTIIQTLAFKCWTDVSCWFSIYIQPLFLPKYLFSSKLLWSGLDTAQKDPQPSLKPSKRVTHTELQPQQSWTVQFGSLTVLYSIIYNLDETPSFLKKPRKKDQFKKNHLTKKMDRLLAFGKLDNDCTHRTCCREPKGDSRDL